ncbi:MAG: hypothetical protein M0Q88_00335 [Bacilli bacterium]|nr:hypothetical protein [Bacilli bacterium]
MLINKKHDTLYIDEAFLDENIPRDLVKLYRNTQPYSSHKNPDTYHSEVGSARNRRFATYDYGKAKYKVISPEEAIRMVRNNKEEIQNLRIIFEGNLVEYEVRNNGSIYAIYRSLEPITLGGVDYKNVGYAPWIKVIQAAEKIYWTDEYDQLISREKWQDRANRNSEIRFFEPLRPGDSGYNPHKPYDNFFYGKSYSVQEIPDTGAHQWRDERKILYNAYDLARKAVRKLESEKDLYDEEEYNLIKDRLENIKKQALKEYNDALEAYRIKNIRKIKEIPLSVYKFNQKIKEYASKIQTALTHAYNLKKRLEELLTSVAPENDYRNTHSNLKYKLKKAIDDLENDAKRVDDQRITDGEVKADSNNDLNSSELQKVLSDLEDYRKKEIDNHLTVISNIEQEIKKAEELIATLRPRTATKKANIAAANKKEMDAELADIIDFTSFSS